MDDNRLTKREYDDVFTALMHRGMRSPTTSKVLKLLDPEGRLKSKRPPHRKDDNADAEIHRLLSPFQQGGKSKSERAEQTP